MRIEEFKAAMWQQARDHDLPCTTELRGILYPFRDVKGRSVYLSVAFVYTLEYERNGKSSLHNVVIGMRQRDDEDAKDVAIWCGDQFLEGRKLTGEQAEQRCEKAVERLPNADELAQKLMANYRVLPASTECNFWALRRAKPPKLCKHCQTVLARYFQPESLDEMATMLDGWVKPGAEGGITTDPNGALDQLLFKVPVLFEGDRGSGKTFEAHSFARAHSLPLIEIGGHEGVEAMDLLGTYVPVGDGSLVWKDGPMSQAFRSASKGQKTVLLIDELLRIPTRQQSVLLTALSPIDGCYRLRTGRIINVEDGVGEEEVLSCKVEDLAIIATTNVGADYALDNLDPAIAERWMILRKDTTADSLRDVLGSVLKSKGFKADLAKKLIRFFEKAKAMCKAGQISRAPTTRTLVRAVELANQENEVGTMLLNQALLWVERDLDGCPITEQIDSVRKLVKAVFPEASGKALL